MFDRLAVWLLSATLALLSSAAFAANKPGAPGGSGKLTFSGAGRTCFDTPSKQVPIVCGKPVVHYKLTTLMGDALGHYGLTWQLDSIHIAAAKGHQIKEGTAHRYPASGVPPAVWDAAQKTELMFYGAALVAGASPAVALQFNTGVSVKPGGELSFNVPDGYNWDKFLIYPRPGGGLQWACSEQAPKYVEPADAKNLMRNGLELKGLQVCPRTSVDVSRLERAIETFCAANAKHPALFCDKDREDDPFASLKGGATGGGSPSQDMDSAFAKAEAQRVATIERQRKLDTATASCERDIAVQESCAKGPCEAEPAKQACIRSESSGTGGSCPKGQRCYVFRSFQCAEYGPNPAHAKWQACVRDAAATCAAQGQKITSLSACVNERFKP